MGNKGRKAPEPKKGLPGWMATFSDMVTLLLTFFVMLMSMANFDDSARVEAVLESIQAAFGVDGIDALKVGLGKEPSFPSVVAQRDRMQPDLARLRDAFSKQVSSREVLVSSKPGELRILLDDRVFFRPGDAEVHPAALLLVRRMTSALRDLEEVQVGIEGHTDQTGDEDENWELSSDRAVSVVRVMRTLGLPGERLSAVGRGQFVPAVTHDADRSWNRRIELVVRGDDSLLADFVERFADDAP